MTQKKNYTYGEFESLPNHIKRWASKISVWDDRPAHPEDYINMAYKILDKASGNQCIAEILFARVITLFNNPKCHTDFTYSFLDFFDYVLGRSC